MSKRPFICFFIRHQDSAPSLAVPSVLNRLSLIPNKQTHRYHGFLFCLQNPILTVHRPTLLDPTLPDPPLLHLFLRLPAPQLPRPRPNRLRSNSPLHRPRRLQCPRASSLRLLLFFAHFG